MLVPKIITDNLFDDWMDDFSLFKDFDNLEKKLYGKHLNRVMLTDVHEKDNHYEVDIDLPGFKKDEIKIELNNGHLLISAAKNIANEEKDEKGKIVRQERYSGSMQRSFFIGKEVNHEDIKAKFEDGVLKLTVPKKENKAVSEKKNIMIEE